MFSRNLPNLMIHTPVDKNVSGSLKNFLNKTINIILKTAILSMRDLCGISYRISVATSCFFLIRLGKSLIIGKISLSREYQIFYRDHSQENLSAFPIVTFSSRAYIALLKMFHD